MFGTKKELLEIKTELDKIKNQLIIPKSNSEEISENEKELKKWETGKISDKEKLMAAYALNLCTVSVSQVVDYSDLVILEQEYEAILNNLNLENFPKDEALLDILKQILDTVTFFRIQEGDKKFIDREYQQKMKNAIWSAVPNIGLIVAGGNPITMAISLASQVGIGYMNYRKEKAKNQLEYEKQKWQLQRSAIEQFNALRRELFTTAWRLADKYNFPDEYRLTEKQITQYNDILMDENIFRKYERLYTIKENFEAYPPFWYYLGNAANAVAQEYLEEDKTVYNKYKDLAFESFNQYWKVNNLPLLRKDDIAASCALEHIDLLIQDGLETNKEKINELLGIAIKNAGNSWDIIQLCTMNYLRLGNFEEAKKYLRILVTEDYNASFNAQILSQRYVGEAIEKNDERFNYPEYETLKKFVNSGYLYPWPKDMKNVDAIKDKYFQLQKSILKWKYASVVLKLIEKYTIILNRQTQCPADDYEKEYTDSYFLDTPENIARRKEDNERYPCNVDEKSLGFIYLDVLNSFLNSIKQISLFSDIKYEGIKNKLMKSEIKQFFGFEDKTNGTNGIEDIFDGRISFTKLVLDFVIKIGEKIECIDTIEESNVQKKEQELFSVCSNEGIELPEIPILDNTNSEKKATLFLPIEEIWGKNAKKIQKENEDKECQKKLLQKQLNIANDKKENKLKLLIQATPEYKKYFDSNQLNSELYDQYKKDEILAVLDDTSFENTDLFFLKYHVLVVKTERKKTFEKKTSKKIAGCSYRKVEFSEFSKAEKYIKIDDFEYKNKNLDVDKFKKLIEELQERTPQDENLPAIYMTNNCLTKIQNETKTLIEQNNIVL